MVKPRRTFSSLETLLRIQYGLPCMITLPLNFFAPGFCNRVAQWGKAARNPEGSMPAPG